MAVPQQVKEISRSEKGTPAVFASVIIVNYNGGEMLSRCIQSVLAHGELGQELILVDNASTDSSSERVKDLYPQVRLVRLGENKGFGQGNNIGAEMARGKYLAFLNPDTEVSAGWLEAMLQRMEEDPTVGLVTAKIRLLNDPSRLNTCGNQIHITGLTLCRGLGDPVNAFGEGSEVSAISGAAFAMRRGLFEQLEGFDSDFFMYMEDTDLSLRARLAGYRCWYEPASLVSHDYALRFGPRKTFYQERNRYLMWLKCLQWRTIFLLLPVWLLGEVVTWGFILTNEPTRINNKLKAYAWILRNLRDIMARRREVQATRRRSDRALLKGHSLKLDFEQVGGGRVARLAGWLFNPAFALASRLALWMSPGG